MNEFAGARPFDLWDLVPAALATVIPNVMWSRERLHRLALPTVEIAIDELRWQLALPWWRDGERRFAVSPDEVRRAPARYARQWQRTVAAEFEFPIHLLQRDRLIMLDGVHRLLKADVEARSTVAAHVVGHERFMADVVERG
jgi:hypothetical protein